MITQFKKPRRLADGSLDLVWWKDLSLPEKMQYDVSAKDDIHNPVNIVQNNKIEVVLKPEILDLSSLHEGDGFEEYRPKVWDEYVGQENAKAIIQANIKGCLEHNEPYPHTFLSAPAGMGKTLFAMILANQLNKNIVITTGGELKTEQILVDKIAQCNGGILFIDECNRINKRVGFFMLPLMEQFMCGGKKLKSFTIIMASTHKGDLAKDLDALLQRCEPIDLEGYSEDELITILKNYNAKQYPSFIVKDEILSLIAKNCRETPRTARRLLRGFVYIKDWEKVKQYNQIVKDGYTKIDVRILQYLSRYTGAGKNSIAKFLRMKPQTYEYEFEPYLMAKELIEIGARRKITQRGKDFLNEIKS